MSFLLVLSTALSRAATAATRQVVVGTTLSKRGSSASFLAPPALRRRTRCVSVWALSSPSNRKKNDNDTNEQPTRLFQSRQKKSASSAAAAVAMTTDTVETENPTESPVTTRTTKSSFQKKNNEAFHPSLLLDNSESFVIPYPKSLSPSSIAEFKKCPQSYLFQYLLGLKQPTNLALAKGSMCHKALERLFDLEPHDRNLQVLQNIFRQCWSEERFSEQYKFLFEKSTTNNNKNNSKNEQRDLEAEAIWGRESLDLLANYWQLEDASQIRRNPVKKEVWVSAKLPVLDNNNTNNTNKDDTFLVRGIIDRLDMVRCPDDNSVALRLIDYKTGKAPDLKYAAHTNARIQQEAFDQLLIYALLLRESNQNGPKTTTTATTTTTTATLPLRYVRLFYLNSSQNEATYWDMDLGATAAERDALLDKVQEDLTNVWQSILDMVSQQDLKAFYGCDRKFCYCHQCRPMFPPGTVWEPEPEK